MSTGTSFPRERIRVLLLEGISDTAIQTFQDAGYTDVVRLDKSLSGAELTEALNDAHMVGIRSRTQLTKAVIQAAPKLMGIGCFCIGTNQVDLDAAAELGIPVFNAPHSNTRSVAELVLGLVILLGRGIPEKNASAHRGGWMKSAVGSHELRGRTLGIVGYGHIGSQTSVLAEALGMHVVFYDVEAKLPMGNARQLPTLEAVLAASDFVSLHVPQAPSTKNMMNEATLAAMKPGSFLINYSRGNVVDIDALAAALQEKRLAGAAIDVFPKEPKASGERFTSPLQGMDNVILSPHIGGSTIEAQHNIGIEVAGKLIAYSDLGRTMTSVNFPEISLAPTAGKAHRLLHVHKNVPGILSAINAAQAESKANILGQHLKTTAEIGYVVMDVDTAHSPELLARVSAIPGTLRCRILY